MKLLILCLCLCGCCPLPAEHHEWRCIDGAVHELISGTWVKVDGRAYMNFQEGPIPCAAVPKCGPISCAAVIK